jgi:hypothetical protein
MGTRIGGNASNVDGSQGDFQNITQTTTSTKSALDVNIVSGDLEPTQYTDGDTIDTDSEGNLLIGTTGISGTARAIRTDNNGNLLVSGAAGLAVTNALDATAEDLNAGAYSDTITSSNDFELDHISLEFSTAESRTIALASPNGTKIVDESADTSLDFYVDGEGATFNGGESLSLDIGSTSGACTVDVKAVIKEATSSLSASPSVLVSSPSALEIAKGNVSGTTHVNKFGRNADVDSGAREDVWDGGAVWVAPTTARTHDIVSTSTDDDGSPAGVGARTLRIYGLTSWSSAEVSEDVTMNGTTNVATSNSYVIIHRMHVLTKGATSSNVGTITATAQTDGTVTAQIEPDNGQTLMAIYGIPNTQTAYMTRVYFNTNKPTASSGACDCDLVVNPEPETELTNFLVKFAVGLQTTGTTHVEHSYDPYLKIVGPAIIKINALPNTNNFDTAAGFDLILVDN